MGVVFVGVSIPMAYAGAIFGIVLARFGLLGRGHFGQSYTGFCRALAQTLLAVADLLWKSRAQLCDRGVAGRVLAHGQAALNSVSRPRKPFAVFRKFFTLREGPLGEFLAGIFDAFSNILRYQKLQF